MWSEESTWLHGCWSTGDHGSIMKLVSPVTPQQPQPGGPLTIHYTTSTCITRISVLFSAPWQSMWSCVWVQLWHIGLHWAWYHQTAQGMELLRFLTGLSASGGGGRFLHLLMSLVPPTFSDFIIFWWIMPLKTSQFPHLLKPVRHLLWNLQTTLSGCTGHPKMVMEIHFLVLSGRWTRKVGARGWISHWKPWNLPRKSKFWGRFSKWPNLLINIQIDAKF